MAVLGMMTGTLFSLVIVAQWLAVLILPACADYEGADMTRSRLLALFAWPARPATAGATAPATRVPARGTGTILARRGRSSRWS